MRKLWSKIKHWWWRFQYWRAPIQASVDFGFEDKTCIMVYKVVGGVVHIVDTQFPTHPPKHPDLMSISELNRRTADWFKQERERMDGSKSN